MSKNKHVVVTGLMGSGKSTVAALLAEALNRRVSDSDPYLRERYGLSAAEIAARDGAGVLHRREADHVLHALLEQPQIIAAAAGSVEYPEVRVALGDAFVVWLDGPPGVLAERMRSGSHRPHFDPDLEAMLTRMRRAREPYFREVADLVADVAAESPERIAGAVLAEMGLRADDRD